MLQVEWVFGPLVLGIPSAQLLPYLRVARFPKTREILGNLHRPLSRGEEVYEGGDLKAADERCLFDAEKLLDPGLERRMFTSSIVDSAGATRWERDGLGRDRIQLLSFDPR